MKKYDGFFLLHYSLYLVLILFLITAFLKFFSICISLDKDFTSFSFVVLPFVGTYDFFCDDCKRAVTCFKDDFSLKFVFSGGELVEWSVVSHVLMRTLVSSGHAVVQKTPFITRIERVVPFLDEYAGGFFIGFDFYVMGHEMKLVGWVNK